MSKLKWILEKEKALHTTNAKVLEVLQEAKIKSIRNSIIRCAGFGAPFRANRKEMPYQDGCGKSSPLRKWGLVFVYFYNRNTGDPNGGYYEYGDPKYDNLICPKCQKANYTYNHPQKEKILMLRDASNSENTFAWTQRCNHGD